MKMTNKEIALVFSYSCLLLILLFFQSCNTSQNATTQEPVFHFGESPCLVINGQNSEVNIKSIRSVVKRSFPDNLDNINGTIVMSITIDKKGDVVYAEYMPELSTIRDPRFIMSCIEAMRKTKFNEDQNAPEYECGLWTISIKQN